MKLNRKRIILFGLVFVVLIMLGFIWIQYRRPLGPVLEKSSTSIPTKMNIVNEQTVQPAIKSTAIEVCGETSVWNVLLLDSDALDFDYSQESDTTRVIQVDFSNKHMTVFTFSQNLWVDISNLGFTDSGVDATRLGLVYPEFRKRSNKAKPEEVILDGVNATAQVLTQNFGLHFDYYVGLDLDQLPMMIDAVGGLPTKLPMNLTDPITKMEFKAGTQLLTGEQVYIYVKANLGSDLDRIKREELILSSLRSRILDPKIWVKIPGLFLEYQDAVITDLTPEQVNHLICLAKELPKESITQEGIEFDWITPGPDNSLLWDREKVLNRLRELGLVH